MGFPLPLWNGEAAQRPVTKTAVDRYNLARPCSFRLPRVENLLFSRARDARLLPLGERFLIGLRSSRRPRQRIARRHGERTEREPFRQRLGVALPGENLRCARSDPSTPACCSNRECSFREGTSPVPT